MEDLTQNISILRDIVLILFLAVTSWTDTKTARIRNVHTFPTMGLGLVFGLAIGGLDGLTASATGLVAALLIMIPPYAMNVMKAGDAKLLMAIGALMGPSIAFRALLASCFIYVPIAIILLLTRGKLGTISQAAKRLWRFFYTAVHPLLKREPLGTEGAVWTPYGLVLAMATVLVWQTDFLTLKDFTP